MTSIQSTDVHATATEVQQLDDARRGACVAAAALACVVESATDPRVHAEATHLRAVLVAAAEAIGAMRQAVRMRP